MKWKFLKAFKRGHRFFQDPQGRIAIADDSGETPDLTDDGILYIDQTRQINFVDGRYIIPLHNENGVECETVGTDREAIWLHGQRNVMMTPSAYVAASELVWGIALCHLFPQDGKN